MEGTKTEKQTQEQLCFKEQWQENTRPKSSHEETDSHILLIYACHAGESGYYKFVIVTAEDRDVLVLCLGVSNSILRLVPGVSNKEMNKIQNQSQSHY